MSGVLHVYCAQPTCAATLDVLVPVEAFLPQTLADALNEARWRPMMIDSEWSDPCCPRCWAL